MFETTRRVFALGSTVAAMVAAMGVSAAADNIIIGVPAAQLLVDALALHAEVGEVGLDPFEERQVGIAACSVERHQGREDVPGACRCTRRC